MQDIDSDATVREYPALDRKWALLVATSSGWDNYRHQVNVLNIYQQLKSNGYDDDHIVLVIEDDLANNPNNPKPGELISRMGGDNLYVGLKIDYHTRDLSPSDIGEILSGRQSVRLPEVIKADEYNCDMDVWMSNRFTATLQDCFIRTPEMSLRDLYFRLFQSTVGSHVCVFSTKGYGSLYSTYLDEILD